MRIARDCGFGIYHVDLVLLRARLALEEGNADAALTDVNTAVFNGIHPPEDFGLPELGGSAVATSRRCASTSCRRTSSRSSMAAY